jgi:hypothetical protein
MVFTLASWAATADDKKDTPALSGLWAAKEGQTKLDFSEKDMLTIAPHGDKSMIAIVCEYTLDKDGMVKVKITDFEGKGELQKKIKELLPVGTTFSFTWRVTNENAKLDDVKGDKIEQFKAHLEGDYELKK